MSESKATESLAVYTLADRGGLRQYVSSGLCTKLLPHLGVFLALALGSQWFSFGRLQALSATVTLFEVRGILKAGVYLLSFSIAVAAVQSLLFSRSIRLRVCSLLFAVGILWAELTSTAIYGYAVSFNEAEIFVREITFAGQAIDTFWTTLLLAFFKAVGIVVLLGAIGRSQKVHVGLRYAMIAPVAYVSTYVIVSWTVAASYLAYPAFIRIPVLLTYVVQHQEYHGPRSPVHMTLANPDDSKPRLVIVIVDVTMTLLLLNKILLFLLIYMM